MIALVRDLDGEARIHPMLERTGLYGGDVPLPRCYRAEAEGLSVLMGREPFPDDPRPRWHVSIQHDERVPSWNEVTEVLHHVRPGVPFVLGVPPRSWWMNVHERVLHAWETRDRPLIESWRQNATGHTPTPGDR